MAAKRTPQDAADAEGKPARVRSVSGSALHKRALRALMKNDLPRVTVAMPYGCGATSLGRAYADAVDATLTVVCVPSMEAARAALVAYRASGRRRWSSAIVVGCDEGTGFPVPAKDLGLPERAAAQLTSTTSSTAVREFLSTTSNERRLIVTTHDSARRVGGALRNERMVADLVVCEDAQHLSGQPRRLVRALVGSVDLPSERRLFLRATDVEAAAWDVGTPMDETDLVSLQDESTFGPTVYAATREEARRCQLVVVPEVAAVANPRSRGTRDRVAEGVLAALGGGARRLVSFHGTAVAGRRLAEGLDGRRLPDGRVVKAVAVEDRSATVGERVVAAALLADRAADVVVVAARVGSGVDVHAADCVVVDPTQSATEIVEVVGQCSQSSADKAGVRIVLPVVRDEGFDDDTALGYTSWRASWMVLRALWAQDGASARELLQIWEPHPPTVDPGRVRASAAREGSFTTWTLRALDPSGRGWWKFRDTLEGWARQGGCARRGGPGPVPGMRVDLWTTRQRTMRQAGMLTAAQVGSLELPGFAWSQWEVAWWQAASCWAAFQREAGPWEGERGLWEALGAARAYDGEHPPKVRFETLAEFAVETCALRFAGRLAGPLERFAETLPGWRWDLLGEGEWHLVDALRDYVAWNGDFNVPHDCVWDDQPLGAWMTALQRRRVTGRLSAVLELVLDRLQAEYPDAMPLRWETEATVWRLNYLALWQFSQREGHSDVPFGHREVLPDYVSALWRWVVGEQYTYQHGTLAPECADAMEAVIGWGWGGVGVGRPTSTGRDMAEARAS